MVIGGLIGGVVGVIAARLYLRSAEEEAVKEGEVELPSLEPGDVIKMTLSVLGILRLIDSLGKPSKQRSGRGSR
jgi:hypothetical protein